MHSTNNKKEVSLKTRFLIIMFGFILIAILTGLMIWSSIEIDKLPSTYSLDSVEYHHALTFGMLNGISVFSLLVLLINIFLYLYSTKIFNKIIDFGKHKTGENDKNNEETACSDCNDNKINNIKNEESKSISSDDQVVGLNVFVDTPNNPVDSEE